MTGLVQLEEASSGSATTPEGGWPFAVCPQVDELVPPPESTRRRKSSTSSLLRAIMRIDNPFNLDTFIANLLALKKYPGKNLKMEESDIKSLCLLARRVLLDQPTLVDLAAPVNIVGDIHGQFDDLLCHFDKLGYPPEQNYLFLGDYVDRGKQSLETICLVLAYKVKYPNNFFILRGNHECASINRIYGFYDECKRRYSIKLWKTFTDVFNCLPLAALIEDTIFCMHGGLSPEFDSFQQIRNLPRPLDVPDSGLICDLLWSDPEQDLEGWEANERGVSWIFGGDVVRAFLDQQQCSLVVRAHQVVEDGYQFFERRGMVTVFSAPGYCGEFDNAGAVMAVSEDLTCWFSIIAPDHRKTYIRKTKL